MDLSQVRYFNAVARHGSFSAAAKALGVTQPGLTKAVRRLEASLDCTLFQRLPRGVALTQQGQALLRHASLLEVQIEDARKEVRALAGGAFGELRIGAGPSWLSRALPRIVAEALQRISEAQLPRCRRLQQCPDGGAEQRQSRSRRVGPAGPMSRRDCRRSRSPPTPSRPLPGEAIRCAASGGRSLRARSPIRGSCPDATSCCGRVSKPCFTWPGSSRRLRRSKPTRSPSLRRSCATATCCRSRHRRCCAARWTASRRFQFPG